MTGEERPKCSRVASSSPPQAQDKDSTHSWWQGEGLHGKGSPVALPGLWSEASRTAKRREDHSSMANLGPPDVARRVSTAHAAQDIELQQLLHPRRSESPSQQKSHPLAPSVPSSGLTRLLVQVAVACIGAYLFGYNLSVVNGPMDLMSAELGFGENSVAKGFVVSAFLVGAFIGCTICSQVADGLGRRKGFQATALPVLLGSTLSALSTSLHMMIAGRLLVGIGLGIGSPLPTLYISEISPPSLRGTLNSLPQVAACIGILLALGAGVYFPVVPHGWRWCFWVGAVPAACLVLLAEYLIESPRWLAQRGLLAEAEKALDSLQGPGAGKQELAGLKADAAKTDTPPAKEVPLVALFKPPYANLIFIGSALYFFQQFSGINSVFYFSSVIFKNAGIQSEIVGNVAVGLVNLAAAFVSMYLMDRAGRKTLMGSSFALMGVFLALQLAFTVVSAHVPSLAWLGPQVSLFSTLAYVMAFALGAGPVPGLLLPEIFPMQIRAKGMAVALCVHWVCNSLVGLFFLPCLENVGSKAVSAVFCAICFLAAAFTFYWVPETKGKSLEEIEAALGLR